MNYDEIYCAFHGHFTLGPTGNPIMCLRCGTQLDGLGLDPRLSPPPTTVCPHGHATVDGCPICTGVAA